MDSVIASMSTQSPSVLNTTTFQFLQAQSATWVATEGQRKDTVAWAGTIKQFYASVATAPGVGASWVLTVRKNGSDTLLTCTISGTNTTCNDTGDTVSVAAGDSVDISALSSAVNPVATGVITWTVAYTANANESIIMGASANAVTASSTTYIAMQNDNAIDGTRTNRESPMPTGGALSNLYVVLDGIVNTGTYPITLYVNGTPSTLTCTVANAAATCNDVTHTVTINAGDLVATEIQSGVTARRVEVGYKWAPTTDGESVSLFHPQQTVVQSATRFNNPSGGASTWSTTEAPRQDLAQASVIKKLYVNSTSVGGSGQTLTVTMRDNAADLAPSVTCIINSGSTTCNDTTHSGTINAADPISIKAVTSATTGTLSIAAGFVFYIAPAGGATITPLRTLTGVGL